MNECEPCAERAADKGPPGNPYIPPAVYDNAGKPDTRRRCCKCGKLVTKPRTADAGDAWDYDAIALIVDGWPTGPLLLCRKCHDILGKLAGIKVKPWTAR